MISEVFVCHFALLLVAVQNLGFWNIIFILIFFFFWKTGVELPPPPTCLEKLKKKGLVVSPANETIIVSEIFTPEVQLDVVTLIQRQKKVIVHLFFAQFEEILGF